MRIVLKQYYYSLTFRVPARKRHAAPQSIPPSEAGLTLVEMIVVLAIIAIVGSLVVMNVISRPDEARVTTARTDIKTISAALKMYRLDNGNYPTQEQGLKALVEKPTSAPVPAAWSAEGYLPEPPKDPWGNPYSYTVTGTGFELKSFGKDGKPGGEGLDADIDGKQG